MKQKISQLQKRSLAKVESKVYILNAAKITELDKLLKKGSVVIDTYEEQLRELFAIDNPALYFQKDFDKKFNEYKKNISKKSGLPGLGNWIYFPWLNTLVHVLIEKDFFKVRTARNKLLINSNEQNKFYNACVGIAGLSIGSSVVTALVLQGGVKHIKLADFDTLALSNTNRIKSGIQNLGLPKVEMVARQIYEINPYAKIKIFPEGVNEQNITNFVKNLDVLVDEMDSLPMKLLLRKEAKKFKIPVVMGADNGDMAVIDVERYDKKSPIKFFHGRITTTDVSSLKNLNKFEVGKTIAGLIGLENHTERMLNSLTQMGKTVVSWPQLGGTAMLNGAAVAYCVRKIICSEPLINGRGVLSLDGIFEQGYFSKKQKKLRSQTVRKFKKILGI